MNAGVQKSEAQMPKEMIAIIEQVFGESGALRQNLLGQLLGVITGEGPQKWVPDVPGKPGYYETILQPPSHTGNLNRPPSTDEGYSSWGGGGESSPQASKVWVPGTPEKGGHWEASGEPGVQLPIIAQAQEKQRLATSRALAQTEADLARKGMAGDPFGISLLANMQQQGQQQVASVEQQILQQFLQMIPGMVTGNIQSIMGALPGTRENAASGFSMGIGGNSGVTYNA
jgi:hypothetical protein